MKIVSSFINDIILEERKYHAFSFESSYLLKLFKQGLVDFFNNKLQSETQFLNVLDFTNNELSNKNFHFIFFDCNHIDLAIDKNTNTQIQRFLFYQLENNPNMIEQFSIFQNQLYSFVSSLELVEGELSIEFQYNEKSVLNLIKSLEIIIEYEEGSYIPNYKVRDYLIKSMLKMNSAKKEPILVVSHPETDVGRADFNYAIGMLKSLEITTIVLSSQREFLTAAADERLHLVDQYGDFCDIINLRKELNEFNIIKKDDPEEMVRSIALVDFNKDYQLLSGEIREFLTGYKL